MKIAGEKVTRDELALALTIGFLLQAVVAIGLFLVQGPTPAAIGTGLGAVALAVATRVFFRRGREADLPRRVMPPRSTARFSLGVAQMVGSVVAASLFLREGLTPRVVSVVVGTGLLTAVSLAVFRGRARQD